MSQSKETPLSQPPIFRSRRGRDNQGLGHRPRGLLRRDVRLRRTDRLPTRLGREMPLDDERHAHRHPRPPCDLHPGRQRHSARRPAQAVLLVLGLLVLAVRECVGPSADREARHPAHAGRRVCGFAVDRLVLGRRHRPHDLHRLRRPRLVDVAESKPARRLLLVVFCVSHPDSHGITVGSSPNGPSSTARCPTPTSPTYALSSRRGTRLCSQRWWCPTR